MSEPQKPERDDSRVEVLSPSCRWVDEALEAFVDGELEAAVEDRVRTHVAGCRRCRESLGLAGRIRHELAELAVPCPDGVEEGLRRRLAARERPSWRQALRLLPIAATIAALAVLGVVLLLRSGEAKPDPAEIAAAEEQIRLALSYVGEVSLRSADVAVDEVLAGELAQTVEVVVRRLDRSLAAPVAEGTTRSEPSSERPSTARTPDDRRFR